MKMKGLASRGSVIVCFCVFLSFSVFSQQATSPSLLQIGDRYWMQPDVVYGSANNTPLKLDIWYPRDNPNPTPTLVYIHGGGWIFGSKEGSVYQLLPYLERGWRVVRSEEHTSELQSQSNLVCRLLLEKKNHTRKVKKSE